MRRNLRQIFSPSKTQLEDVPLLPTPIPPLEPQAAKVKDSVFRVTGIPPTLTTASLENSINSDFSAEQVTVDTSRTKICFSCSDSKTRTGVIGFKPHSPQALEKLASPGTYEIEIPELQCDISIDRDFHGLTQLYPTQGTIQADIVAVSGLNEHAYGSWRGGGKTRRMWLCDFMKDDFPECRTMIYGYNSNLDSNGTHTILDYAKTFLEELTKARRLPEENQRPIVFIGHGFGGIIVAQALVRAKFSHPHLFLSTRATIFFSTPHRGLVIDDMLAMLGENSPRAPLLRSIEREAELLVHELARFIDYSVAFKIVNFVQSNPTQKLQQGPDGRWSRSGELFMTVGRDSSMLRLPSLIEQTLTIEGDHLTIVKFQHSGNPGYTSVVRHINNFISEASNARSVDKTMAATQTSKNVENGTALISVGSEAASIEQFSGREEEKALGDAAAQGRIEIVRRMLENGVSTTGRDRNGNTPLHRAVQHGHIDIVLLLLEHNADIMARGFKEATALIMAAANGYKRLMILLWERGTDVTATDSNGHTVLHAAAQNGYPELVRLLLDGGVRISTATGKDTPLALAASGGFEDVVEVLLERGDMINERGRLKMNATR